jgi:outer membrane protein insertion porin family
MKKDLSKLKYINQIDIDTEVNSKLVDISLNLEENKKTGNFLLGGSFSGDTGLGFGLGIKDFNIFGSGNAIDANFNLNSEQVLFALNYTQYPLSKINLKNNYSLFNSEKDLTNSYGFKVDEQGFGYGVSYEYSKNIDISSSFKLSKYKGHSGSNNNIVVTDNIGDRNHFNLNLSILRDTTNDIWYPTNGSKNRILFSLNPESLSDDPYYKMVLSSDLYRKRKNNQNFFFLSNRIGLSESLSGNLNTVNVFGLGGMNFKGFDYRGVGPFEGKIYLGGNKYFTSTVGYGGSFIFDQKDNINVKVFATSGSIWDSDYSNDDSFDIRTSVGVSFDIMSVIPISLTYAIPIDKESTDKTREFNFAIGTSF